MSDLFNFSVVTPEQTYLDGEASMVVVPGIEGDIGFLANHANIITSLRPGTIVVTSDKDTNSFNVEKGFVKFSENKLLVVADGIVSE